MKQRKRVRRIKRKLMRVIHQDNFKSKHRILISSKLMTEGDIHGEATHDGFIILNPSKVKGSNLNEFLSTFIHECLHILFRKRCERFIRRLEYLVYADFACSEKEMLLCYIAQNATWDD
jgi:predicted metal-dependent peptidase